MKTFAIALLAGSALFAAQSAAAAVIAGPTLDTPGSGWIYTGIEFHANQNATLTGFTFQNQGQADTVVLTDLSGNILQSLATPGGVGSYVASVAWALAGGSDYRLLQTVLSNEYYAFYSGSLPTNPDISITKSGVFAYDIGQTNNGDFAPNEYWAAFNDVTTGGGGGGVPEPATWALMIMGFGATGLMLRGQRRRDVAA